MQKLPPYKQFDLAIMEQSDQYVVQETNLKKFPRTMAVCYSKQLNAAKIHLGNILNEYVKTELIGKWNAKPLKNTRTFTNKETQQVETVSYDTNEVESIFDETENTQGAVVHYGANLNTKPWNHECYVRVVHSKDEDETWSDEEVQLSLIYQVIQGVDTVLTTMWIQRVSQCMTELMEQPGMVTETARKIREGTDAFIRSKLESGNEDLIS